MDVEERRMRCQSRRSRMNLVALAIASALISLVGPGIVQAAVQQDAESGVGVAPPTIRFNFKDATFEQVVDFFARTTGMPVVWESDAPEGTRAEHPHDLPRPQPSNDAVPSLREKLAQPRESGCQDGLRSFERPSLRGRLVSVSRSSSHSREKSLLGSGKSAYAR